VAAQPLQKLDTPEPQPLDFDEEAISSAGSRLFSLVSAGARAVAQNAKPQWLSKGDAEPEQPNKNAQKVSSPQTSLQQERASETKSVQPQTPGVFDSFLSLFPGSTSGPEVDHSGASPGVMGFFDSARRQPPKPRKPILAQVPSEVSPHGTDAAPKAPQADVQYLGPTAAQHLPPIAKMLLLEQQKQAEQQKSSAAQKAVAPALAAKSLHATPSSEVVQKEKPKDFASMMALEAETWNKADAEKVSETSNAGLLASMNFTDINSLLLGDVPTFKPLQAVDSGSISMLAQEQAQQAQSEQTIDQGNMEADLKRLRKIQADEEANYKQVQDRLNQEELIQQQINEAMKKQQVRQP